MGWQDKLGDILKTAKDVSGILSAFKVPGAKTVSDAVKLIHGDGSRSNDDATSLLAATVDVQERRITTLEKELKILKAKK